MTVSIVIPCFNQGHFLGAAIASARAQYKAPLEIIVVDDGSTDGSAAAAAGIDGVTCLRQANAGVARARNAGLAASRGDVVIFLDADDRLMPLAVAAAAAVFTEHARAQMTFGRCQLIDREGTVLPSSLPEVTGAYYEELLRRNFIWMPAMAAFRRSVFSQTAPFDERINPSADYDVYLRIAREFEIVSHGWTVAQYRRHGGNMSGDPALMLRASLAVLRAQRPHVRRDTRLQRAYAAGIRHWEDWYGEQLVDRFRSAWRESRHGAWLRDAGLLLRLHPRGVLRHLRRKRWA